MRGHTISPPHDAGQCFTYPPPLSLWAPAEAFSSSSNKARSARQLTPSSSAGPTVHALSGSALQEWVHRAVYVIMRTNETPLAAATHKLNQLKDKAGLSDAPADDSGRPGASVDEQQPEACGGPAQQLTQQLSSSRPRSGSSKCLTSCSQPCHLRLVSACGASRGCAVGPVFHSVLLCVSFVCDRTVLLSAARGVRDMRNILVYKKAS